MNRNFFYIFTILTLVIFIDQFTKMLALNNEYFVTNSGMMFGSFSNSSGIVRISLITSGSVIFFMIYFGLIYFLSDKLYNLKIGISFLFGGALSNALDKVIFNFVIDFIPISIGDYIFYANISDIIQIFGVGIILYYLFVCQDEIWFPEDKRSDFLISPQAQIIFAMKFFLVCFFALIMMSVFSYTYMDIELLNFTEERKTEYILLVSLLCIVFGALIFIFGIILSHHFYGPIYKLNKYINEGSWNNSFTLRENDQFKELESLVDRIKNDFKEK